MRDFEIRGIIRKTLLNKYYLDRSSKVVEELDLPVARARIDMAVINGHLHGYEIKSSRDTLARLAGQIVAYSKVFDYVTVVTEARYESKLLVTLPEWVGVSRCIEEGEVVQIRACKLNVNKEKFYLAKLLWRDELIEVLQTSSIRFRKADRHWTLCEQLAEAVDVDTLSGIVRRTLKSRSNWKSDE